MTQEFLTTVGRIVWGNPAKSSVKKDQRTKQPVIRDGKQVEQWAFGVAFPKAEFNQYILPWLQYEAQTVYPSGVPAGFSWKYKDGDGVDRQGKPYNTREGYAGNCVLTVSTEAFAPQIYKNEGGRYRQIEPHEIKCGDYVVVKLNVKANKPTDPTHTPGLYINPQGIELVGYGQEIVNSGADPDEMFGGRTYQLPPGASATPQAPTGGAMPPYAGGAPMPGQMPPGMSQQAPQAAPAPMPTPQPAAAPAPMQYGQPQPGFTPPAGAPIAAGNFQPPSNAVPAGVGPATAYPSNPGMPPQAAPMPAPAHDFVNNAVQQPGHYAPAPVPGQMPGMPPAR